MTRLTAQELIEKYKNNTLTDQERALLETFYLELTRSKDKTLPADELEDDLVEIWEKINKATQAEDKKPAKVVPIVFSALVVRKSKKSSAKAYLISSNFKSFFWYWYFMKLISFVRVLCHFFSVLSERLPFSTLA